jgi:hypothetical protein
LESRWEMPKYLLLANRRRIGSPVAIGKNVAISVHFLLTAALLFTFIKVKEAVKNFINDQRFFS